MFLSLANIRWPLLEGGGSAFEAGDLLLGVEELLFGDGIRLLRGADDEDDEKSSIELSATVADSEKTEVSGFPSSDDEDVPRLLVLSF